MNNAGVQKPTIDFIGFPWPNFGHGGTAGAIEKIKKSDPYKAMLAAIAASSAPKFYIVGHSSGCAIANDADEQIKDTSKVALVSLDGFKPSKAQRGRGSTQVWAAQCGDATSFNYPGPSYEGLHVYPATVKSYWALHFSLVNTKTTDTKPATSIETGYDNCEANLCWL